MSGSPQMRSSDSKDSDTKSDFYQKLKGKTMPPVALKTTDGRTITLDSLAQRYILVVQPGPSTSKCQLPENWSLIKGAPGCTGEAQGFNKLLAEFKKLGYEIFGLNNKSTEQQKTAKAEKGLKFELISDEELKLAKALNLHVSEAKISATQQTIQYMERLTLVVENGVIKDVIDQIPEPAKNAEQVLARLPKLAAAAVASVSEADELKARVSLIS